MRMAGSVVHTVHGIISKSITAAERVSVLMSPAKMRHERGCQRDRQGAATTDLCYTEGIRYNGSAHTKPTGLQKTHRSSVGGGAAALEAPEVLKKT